MKNKNEEAFRATKAFLAKNGATRMLAIWKNLKENADFSYETYKNMLAEKAESGELFRYPKRKAVYYCLPGQAGLFIQRIQEEAPYKRAGDSAIGEAQVRHSSEIRKLIGRWSDKLPLVNLSPRFPGGGLQLNVHDVKSYSLGTRGPIKGPDQLPLQDEPLFDHLFVHSEFGKVMRDAWDSFIRELIEFEKEKGKLYLTIEDDLKKRFNELSRSLMVNAIFVDCIYLIIINNDEKELKRVLSQQLLREGPFYRIELQQGTTGSGWLCTNRKTSSKRFDKSVNSLKNKVIKEEWRLMTESVRIQATEAALLKRLDVFRDRLQQLGLRQLFSGCSLVKVD